MQNMTRLPHYSSMPLSASDAQPVAPVSGIKVIVGMSGGVDSSVAALLLMRQGYEVEGLFMKNWDEDDGTEYCTAKDDLADAQAVCDTLGIRLHTANFAVEYWDNVFEHFLAEYSAGRTPNPDILCNREIKFKVFLDYAEKLGADLIATGHYCRVHTPRGSETGQLLKGLDPNKDQSYFLHAVTGKALSKTLFPIGELEKPEVRRLAKAAGLVTARKKDSTGICFIGERRFNDFLRQYLSAPSGVIQTPNGDVIGEHSGLMHYTIGQRQGLGIGGLRQYDESPWYVAAKDLANNRLIAVQGKHHPLLYSDALTSERIEWIAGQAPLAVGDTLALRAKVRYRQRDQACDVTLREDGSVSVRFSAAQRAVTPGQSLVLYDGDVCLGGGVIVDAQCSDRTHAQEYPT